MAKPAQEKKPYTMKGTNLITFKGEAQWCKYLEKQLVVDQYAPKGEYSVDLVGDPEDAEFQAL